MFSITLLVTVTYLFLSTNAADNQNHVQLILSSNTVTQELLESIKDNQCIPTKFPESGRTAIHKGNRQLSNEILEHYLKQKALGSKSGYNIFRKSSTAFFIVFLAYTVMMNSMNFNSTAIVNDDFKIYSFAIPLAASFVAAQITNNIEESNKLKHRRKTIYLMELLSQLNRRDNFYHIPSQTQIEISEKYAFHDIEDRVLHEDDIRKGTQYLVEHILKYNEIKEAIQMIKNMPMVIFLKQHDKYKAFLRTKITATTVNEKIKGADGTLNDCFGFYIEPIYHIFNTFCVDDFRYNTLWQKTNNSHPIPFVQVLGSNKLSSAIWKKKEATKGPYDTENFNYILISGKKKECLVQEKNIKNIKGIV